MRKKPSISRRNVLKLSSAAVGALLAKDLGGKPGNVDAGPIAEAAGKVGRLPRRKLGYSNREVSIIIGAGDMEETVAEATAATACNTAPRDWISRRNSPVRTACYTMLENKVKELRSWKVEVPFRA